MQLSLPSLKTTVNAQILFLTSLLGHHLAGGTFVSSLQILALLVAIFITLLVRDSHLLTGPGLALRVIVAQSLGHFIFGGGDKSSEMMMLFSHILMGHLSYFLISSSEQVWNGIARLLEFFQPQTFSRTLVSEAISEVRISCENYSEKKILLWLAKNFRGPPMERDLKHAS